MKKAFISYSLTDQDRFVVSKLTSALQQQNMVVGVSQNFFGEHLDFSTKKNIDSANLFIGIITDKTRTDRVLNEWEYATERAIPNILVIEENIRVANNSSLVRFNRHNIDSAITKVRQKISEAKATHSEDEWLKWVLGGPAVVALLSNLYKH